MNLTGRAKTQIGVVLLYDPVPLDKVSLDRLKTHFPSVTSYLPEQEAVTAESTEEKRWAQIFTTRTEFVDQNEGTAFSAAAIEPLNILLGALPPLRIRSFGINLHVRGTVEGFQVAGEFLTKTFVKGVDQLQEKLKAKIIATAQRFTYGETSKYYDVRVTPETLDGPVVHVQLHRHVEGEIADAARLFSETSSEFDAGVKELERLVQLL